MAVTTDSPPPIELQFDFAHPLHLVLLVAVVLFLIYLARRPGRYDKIEEWCRARQLRVVHLDARYSPFRQGPFSFTTRGTVFYVTVADPLGFHRHLWVRCSDWGANMTVVPAD